MDVCRDLKAIFNTDQKSGFEIFHDWSKEGKDKYRGMDDCLKLWKSTNANTSKNVIKHLGSLTQTKRKEMKITHAICARIGKDLLDGTIVCVDTKQGRGYHCTEQGWEAKESLCFQTT